MHKIILATLALAFSSAWAADTYHCTDKDGSVAILMIEGKWLDWNEPWRAAMSDGENVGIETADNVAWLGFERFRLNDFYSKGNASYILAVPDSRFRLGGFPVFKYFDNNDLPEDITPFHCDFPGL